MAATVWRQGEAIDEGGACARALASAKSYWPPEYRSRAPASAIAASALSFAAPGRGGARGITCAPAESCNAREGRSCLDGLERGGGENLTSVISYHVHDAAAGVAGASADCN
jgi:hypothetical protein